MDYAILGMIFFSLRYRQLCALLCGVIRIESIIILLYTYIDILRSLFC